jgi:hypothetical protein
LEFEITAIVIFFYMEALRAFLDIWLFGYLGHISHITYIEALCTMPRGQSKHTRIGTFACPSNPTAHPKQAKANLPTRDKKTN